MTPLTAMKRTALSLLSLLCLGFVLQACADESPQVKVCTLTKADYAACEAMVKTFFSEEKKKKNKKNKKKKEKESSDDAGAGDDAGADDDGGASDDGDGGAGDDGRRKLMEHDVNWKCVEPADKSESVLQMLENKECNLATDMDAHDVYDANKDWGYQAILAEDYTGDGDGLTYYGIAVVPASTCEEKPNVTLSDFKGGSACSTGYKRTSGWTIPLATILTLEEGDTDVEDLKKDMMNVTDWEVMANFFPEMCSPGGPEEAEETLCSNCIGDCKRGDKEPYSGYAGSLRCLMEGKGEIAFMKETTPLDFAADGNTPEGWSSKSLADLKLVCPDGGCADPADYSRCNYARIPSHMIAVSPDLPVDEIRSEFVDAMKSQEWEDWLATNPSLFKGGTKALVPIEEDTVEYMGKLVDVYKILESLGYY